jgi:hypothetical protein
LTFRAERSAFNSQDIQTNMKSFLIPILALVAILLPMHEARALSGGELDRIGKRIWQNECAGTVNGLTSWNSGENFASLGIGHFIWYPKGVEGPFEESFPKLVAWLGRSGVKLPAWLPGMKDCPWPDRQAFLRDHDGSRQKDLRALLSATVRQQTEFIIARLAEATPKFHAAAGKLGPRVERNIALLQQTGAGNFAMIDYVNFKGEGLNPKERYKGEGWGLLQVLMGMQAADAACAPGAFAVSAKRVLSRRVQNSPGERGERRWLAGWHSRCEAYGR